MKPTRDFYIPEGARLTHSDGAGNAVYFWTNAAGQPCALGFQGKAAKPSFRYRFPSETRRAAYATQFMDRRAEIERERQAERAARAAFVHDVKVGDIFKSSWGYDQTNVDYYQVVKLCGKSMAEVREIAQDQEETGFMSGWCVPHPGMFLDDPRFDEQGRPAYDEQGKRLYSPRAPLRVKIQAGYQGVPCIRVASHTTAFRIQPKEVSPGVKVYAPSHWTAYA